MKGWKHTDYDFINSACVKETDDIDDIDEIIGYDELGNQDEWFQNSGSFSKVVNHKPFDDDDDDHDDHDDHDDDGGGGGGGDGENEFSLLDFDGIDLKKLTRVPMNILRKR